MTSMNGKGPAARRDERTIVEALRQAGLVARLCAVPCIHGLMVSRPTAVLELAAALGRPIETKELTDAVRRENIFEGDVEAFARRRTAERNKLAREAAS